MSTTSETFDSTTPDPNDRQLDLSLGVIKRLLEFAYAHYNDAYKHDAKHLVTYWDGYIRACQHILEAEKE
jgi:hypothetical protein